MQWMCKQPSRVRLCSYIILWRTQLWLEGDFNVWKALVSAGLSTGFQPLLHAFWFALCFFWCRMARSWSSWQSPAQTLNLRWNLCSADSPTGHKTAGLYGAAIVFQVYKSWNADSACQCICLNACQQWMTVLTDCVINSKRHLWELKVLCVHWNVPDCQFMQWMKHQ